MGITIGLVGLGSFGRQFAELFHSHPGVDRVMLCDRDEERMKSFAGKETWGPKLGAEGCYTDYAALLESGVDAVAIFTQPWLHAPQALRALEAGASVYSAVPVIMVPDGDEIIDWCGKLCDAVKSTGKHYMLGETTYYRPEAMFCRRMAREGAFGNFVYAEGDYFHSFDQPGCDLREVYAARFSGAAGREGLEEQKSYIARGKMNGPMHYPTHSVSGPICVMRTRAVKVACFGQAPRTDDPFFDDSGISNETAIFQLANGAVMRICEHRECAVGREGFRIYGDACAYENGRWRDKFKPENNRQPAVEEMRDPIPQEFEDVYAKAKPGAGFYGGHGGSHAYLVNEFVDAVAHDRRPAIDAWEAARYMAAGVAAHKSALAGGELLDVPDFGDGPAEAASSAG